MAKFKDLNAPEFVFLGWYVLCTNEPTKYLHNDGKIYFGAVSNNYLSNGFFDTKEDARKAAQIYYLKHGRQYPYYADRLITTINSQVMDF